MLVGYDVGATNFRFGYKKKNRIIVVKEKTEKNLKKFKLQIVSKLENFKVKEVCFACPGPINLKKGTIVNPPNLKIKKFKVVKFFDNLGIKCYLINDVVAACIGEKENFYKNEKNFCYVSFGSGIGCGVYVDGNLLIGKEGNAHEVGHTVINFDSKFKCSCKKFGHWEAYCSGKNLPNFIKKYFNKEPKNTKEVFENIYYRKFLYKVAKLNGIGLANVIHCYDPNILVLGGRLMYYNWFFKETKKELEKFSILSLPKVYQTKLKDLAGIYGCIKILESKNLKAMIDLDNFS